MDSSATRIFITIKEAGKQLIQVSDDGRGIEEEDIRRFILNLADDFGEQEIEAMDAIDLYDLCDGYVMGLIDASSY